MRGLQKDIDDDPATTPVLQRLKNRVERILKDMEDRTTTGLAAIVQLAALAREKDAMMTAARESGLPTGPFSFAGLLAKIQPCALSASTQLWSRQRPPS